MARTRPPRSPRARGLSRSSQFRRTRRSPPPTARSAAGSPSGTLRSGRGRRDAPPGPGSSFRSRGRESPSGQILPGSVLDVGVDLAAPLEVPTRFSAAVVRLTPPRAGRRDRRLRSAAVGLVRASGVPAFLLPGRRLGVAPGGVGFPCSAHLHPAEPGGARCVPARPGPPQRRSPASSETASASPAQSRSARPRPTLARSRS